MITQSWLGKIYACGLHELEDNWREIFFQNLQIDQLRPKTKLSLSYYLDNPSWGVGTQSYVSTGQVELAVFNDVRKWKLPFLGNFEGKQYGFDWATARTQSRSFSTPSPNSFITYIRRLSASLFTPN